TLRSAGLEVVAHPRPDHATLRASDLSFGDDLPVLVTEKDAVKLATSPDNVYDVPVSAAFRNEASAAIDALLSALCETSAL
ncbi:MAG: tetraacyldisaccharide 4'-kinase, partial [Pseudomonadota bacterium]